jgi:hypothetical protein
MVIEKYDYGGIDTAYGRPTRGDLGMTFRVFAEDGKAFTLWDRVWGQLFSYLDALETFAKAVRWETADDLLILDLDRDGIRERMGWVGANDNQANVRRAA